MGEWRNEDASESSSQSCTIFGYCTAKELENGDEGDRTEVEIFPKNVMFAELHKGCA